MLVIWENLWSTYQPVPTLNIHIPILTLCIFFLLSYRLFSVDIRRAKESAMMFVYIHFPVCFRRSYKEIPCFFSMFFVAIDFQHFSWSISSHLSSSHMPWCLEGYRRRRCIQPAQCDGRSGPRGAFACCWRRQRARRRRTTHAGRWEGCFQGHPWQGLNDEMMMRSGMYNI